MDHVHIQNQNQEEHNLMSNSSTTHKNKQQKSIIIPSSSSSSLLAQQENDDFFSMLNLNSPSSTLARHQRRRNSAKRRALSSSSSSEQRSAKKHSSVQDNGFSAISLPVSLCGNAHVLRRCVSDLCQSSEKSMPMMTAKESGLPPLPPKLPRCMSADVKSVSHSLNTEDNTPDSKKLKRMKDRLREMKQWWDDVMKEEEEEEGIQEEQQEQEEKVQSPVAEDDKDKSQDEFGEDIEEAVSVEWAEKCLSLTFKCPCGKGNEVLISENKCYCKLV
ncbi:unnamed protein product [Trifolium pratense]|uniref:Uncharacterized protein n=1 Tax=Trifolium pratense TaxID=57577 RepID=A0ACB0LHJ6_TRIPR|nr:unnamed protein product [Trifolium pratense]